VLWCDYQPAGGGAARRSTIFEHVHGIGFFEYLAQHPERGAEFQASTVDRSRQEAAEVVAAYDFGSFGRKLSNLVRPVKLLLAPRTPLPKGGVVAEHRRE
jgi:hypothetical protein